MNPNLKAVALSADEFANLLKGKVPPRLQDDPALKALAANFNPPAAKPEAVSLFNREAEKTIHPARRERCSRFAAKVMDDPNVMTSTDRRALATIGAEVIEKIGTLNQKNMTEVLTVPEIIGAALEEAFRAGASCLAFDVMTGAIKIS